MYTVMGERPETGELWNLVALGDITINKSKNEPATMTAVFLRDAMTVENGDIIAVQVDGEGNNNLFYGYVLKTSKEMDEVNVNCYDQLYSLKNNREIKKYGNLKASELISQVCGEKGLIFSEIEDTGYTIPDVIADNTALFDLFIEALNETFLFTGKRFYLNDQFRDIQLHELESNKLEKEVFEVNTDNTESYSYDEDVTAIINEVIVKSNDTADDSVLAVRRNEDSIKRYGTFTYTQRIQDGENPDILADELISQKSIVPCKLTASVYGCSGEIYPGRLIHVDYFSARKEFIKGWFLVESVSFKLSGGTAMTDLDLTVYEMEAFDG